MIKTDVLVIGSGIAGLTFAIKMARKRPDLDILVLTKTDERESNTRYAQGGVAAVWNLEEDSYEKHIADTLDAGDGLCDENVVSIVVKIVILILILIELRFNLKFIVGLVRSRLDRSSLRRLQK